VDEANAKNDAQALQALQDTLGIATPMRKLTHYFYYVINVSQLKMIGLKTPLTNIFTMT
jgi:hypothetical protein